MNYLLSGMMLEVSDYFMSINSVYAIFIQYKVYSIPTLLTVSIQKNNSYLLNQLIWNEFHLLSLKLILSKVTQL